jgi:hypothetical protein
VRSDRPPKFLLGAAALLMAIGVFLAVRSRYPGPDARRSHYYFRTLGSVGFSTAGRSISIFRPEMMAPLALMERTDDAPERSCLTHSLHQMTLDVGSAVTEDEGDSLKRRGVKGALSIVGSGGEIYWEVLLVDDEPPRLFLLERGAVLPLRIDTALPDALLRGCDAMGPPTASSGR